MGAAYDISRVLHTFWFIEGEYMKLVKGHDFINVILRKRFLLYQSESATSGEEGIQLNGKTSIFSEKKLWKICFSCIRANKKNQISSVSYLVVSTEQLVVKIENIYNSYTTLLLNNIP